MVAVLGVVPCARSGVRGELGIGDLWDSFVIGCFMDMNEMNAYGLFKHLCHVIYASFIYQWNLVVKQ